MRETKEQKIARLERKVNEKDNELKSLQKELKETKKELKNNIQNDYESKIKSLKDNIKSIKDENKTILYNNSKLIESNIELLDKIEIYERIVFQSTFKEYLERVESEKGWHIETLRTQYNNYECFKAGLISNKWGIPFFDYNNLIITINPHNGKELNTVQINDIQNIIKNNSLYIEYMKIMKKLIEENKPSYFKDYDYGMITTYNLGKELYDKLYADYDFAKFS